MFNLKETAKNVSQASIPFTLSPTIYGSFGGYPCIVGNIWWHLYFFKPVWLVKVAVISWFYFYFPNNIVWLTHIIFIFYDLSRRMILTKGNILIFSYSISWHKITDFYLFHLFVCLLAISMSFFLKCPYKSFAHIFIWSFIIEMHR